MIISRTGVTCAGDVPSCKSNDETDYALLSHLLLLSLTVMLTCGCSYRGNSRVSDVTLASRENAGLKSKWQVKRDYMNQVKLARQQSGECTCFTCLEKTVLENYPELAENDSPVKRTVKNKASERPSDFALREVVDYADTQPKTGHEQLSHSRLSEHASSRKRDSNNESLQTVKTKIAQPSENYLGINELGAIPGVERNRKQHVQMTARPVPTRQDLSLERQSVPITQRPLIEIPAKSILVSEDPNLNVKFDEIDGQVAESRVAKTDLQPTTDVPQSIRLSAQATNGTNHLRDNPHTPSVAITPSKGRGANNAPVNNTESDTELAAATRSNNHSSPDTTTEVTSDAVTNPGSQQLESALSDVRSAISDVKSELSEVRSALKELPLQAPASNTGVMIVVTESSSAAAYPNQVTDSASTESKTESNTKNPDPESRSNARLNNSDSRQLTSTSSLINQPIVLKARADRRRFQESISSSEQAENPTTSRTPQYHATRDLQIENVDFQPLPKMQSVNYVENCHPKCTCQSTHQSDAFEQDSESQGTASKTLDANSTNSNLARAESGAAESMQKTVNAEVAADNTHRDAPVNLAPSSNPSAVAEDDCQEITIRAIAKENLVVSQNSDGFGMPSNERGLQASPVPTTQQSTNGPSQPLMIQAKSPIHAPYTNKQPDAMKQMPQVSASITTPIYGDHPAIPRLRAVMSQEHAQPLPPLVVINTPEYATQPHQEISTHPIHSTSQEQPRLRWEFPGKFDPIQLPDFENAPLVDLPGVNDSIRRLTARPGDAAAPIANRATIER